MLKIARWYNNFQTPAVLTIDDLSDAYINVYNKTFKNDWGYFCDNEGSAFDFLQKNLLQKYPEIKITFFTPYAKHNVINENSKFKYKKFAVGERIEFTNFLKKLNNMGHEIAHHGSTHGKYINASKPSTVNNWIHEWALFDNVEEGVRVTLNGVKKFKEVCNLKITGGRYCGYIRRENSQEIINKCNFLYWSEIGVYKKDGFTESYFGENNVISFPTNIAGNAFVRLSWLSGDKRRDRKKKFFKYFQPLYSLYSYIHLYKLYKKQQIISIQEHNSPSTSSGFAQSANIVTDINSLNKIFNFLSHLSIWYATCNEIASYIYTRDNIKLEVIDEIVTIHFDNKKKINNPIISLVSKMKFSLIDIDGNVYTTKKNNNKYVCNLKIIDSIQKYKIKL